MKAKCLLNEAKNCKFFQQLETEIKAHKVIVYKWASGSCGHALSKGRVKIPKPQNEDRLGVAFHEIGHVYLRHCDYGNKSLPRYIQEFRADMFMQALLTKHGLLSTRVQNRTRWHLLSRIAMATNRGLDVSKIPGDIVAFFNEIDLSAWANRKVFVTCNNDYEKLTITIN